MSNLEKGGRPPTFYLYKLIFYVFVKNKQKKPPDTLICNFFDISIILLATHTKMILTVF